MDAFTAIESERLSYIWKNQPSLRTEILSNLCDAIDKGDNRGASIGKCIILPSSFTGSPRYMMQHFQDAMAICRWYSNPDLFITMTANSKWQEIEHMLSKTDGHRAEDRPDIVARVFKLKLEQLMKQLMQKSHFGKARAGEYPICFVFLSLHPLHG